VENYKVIATGIPQHIKPLK